MKKIFVFIAILLIACSVFAQKPITIKGQKLFSSDKPLKIISTEKINDNQVKLTISAVHKRGPFTSTKDYTESISLPESLSSQGYKLFKRELIGFEGKGWMINEEMEALGYTCTSHISKNWVESETIKITI